MSTIETPEEFCARWGAHGHEVAATDIRERDEQIAAALREDASEYEKWVAFERSALAVGAIALRIFAARLAPSPPEPRPIAEVGDPVAMAETSRPYCPGCTGRTLVLGQPVPPSSVCGEAPGRAEQLGRVLGAEAAPIQEEALAPAPAPAPALDREAPGAGHEYGIFSDEGLIEGGFCSRAEATAALAARYQPDDGDVRRCCHDHPEHEADSCEECAEEPSCLAGCVVTRGDVGGGS